MSHWYRQVSRMRKMIYTSNRRREIVSALYRFLNARCTTKYSAHPYRSAIQSVLWQTTDKTTLRYFWLLNVSKVQWDIFFFTLRTNRYSVINSTVRNKFIGRTTIYNEFGQQDNSEWLKPRIYYSSYLHWFYKIY